MDTQLILTFLSDLKENNNREWMQANKKSYQAARIAFEQGIEEIITQLLPTNKNLMGLSAKDCLFRLHRDTRFSNNKLPYKDNFGAAITPGGRKSPLAGYYLHLQPEGKSLIAGGCYMPAPEHLRKIRQEIDYSPEELKQLLHTPRFKDTFGQLQGEQLKTAPKGYPKDHPDIELLRFKSYIAIHHFSDEEVCAPQFMDQVMALCSQLQPFNAFFNRAITD